jgi:nucleotide-binding universal stress UspA family protein
MAVVVGVDASEAGRRAADLAAQLQRGGDGRVVVAHVVPWSPFTVQTAQENERRSVAKQHELELGHQLVDPLVEGLRASGIEAEGEVRHGHPAETLCAIAQEVGASHLVVGRTGESRVRSLLFGSTASNLIQIARVPVTVVP